MRALTILARRGELPRVRLILMACPVLWGRGSALDNHMHLMIGTLQVLIGLFVYLAAYILAMAFLTDVFSGAGMGMSLVVVSLVSLLFLILGLNIPAPERAVEARWFRTMFRPFDVQWTFDQLRDRADAVVRALDIDVTHANVSIEIVRSPGDEASRALVLAGILTSASRLIGSLTSWGPRRVIGPALMCMAVVVGLVLVWASEALRLQRCHQTFLVEGRK